MKRRSFFSFLAASVIVLLLTGIGGCNWLPQSHPQTPTAAIFVSKQAPVMMSLLVNPDRLETLGQSIVRPQARRQTRQELNQLKTSLLGNSGLNYKQNIQPWLGDEITVAVTTLDIDRNSLNGQQAGYLMALASKNADKSREFLDLLFSQQAIAGRELEIEQYKGVKLIYDKHLPSQNSLAGAVVGNDFVVFANHPQVLRDALNNVQVTDLNLSSSEAYQKALTKLPSERIGLAFLNLPMLASEKLAPSQTYASQIIALELNPKGLLAETTLLAASEREPTTTLSPQLSQLVGALEYIPKATGLSISGSDLSKFEDSDLSKLWKQVQAVLPVANSSQLVSQPLQELQKRWGIDLTAEIFNWVQGEYALGLLPRADSAIADWIFVTEKSAATEGISRLNAIAEKQNLSITYVPLANQKVAAWTELSTVPVTSADPDRATLTLKAKVYGVHADVGNYEIFTTSVEAMDEALKSPEVGALLNDTKFKTSVNTIPSPNAGYIYLDWTASQAILERQLPVLKLLEVAGKPFFSNLRSLVISSYGNDPETLKGGIFFLFNA